MLLLLVGCDTGTVIPLEVTPGVKETIEITRIVNYSSTPTLQDLTTTSPTYSSTLRTMVTPEVNKVSLDYDAVMVITEFYLLSGHGFHEEAYYLLSSSKQKSKNIIDYVANEKSMKINSITLYTIQPYYEWAIKEGINVTKDPNGIRRFVAWLSAYGVGGMAGSVPNGIIQHPIITMIIEQGEWKICSIDTIPTINPSDCK